MRFFYIDVVNQKCTTVVMEDKLQNYYEKLNCECIDIVQIEVNGVEFDVICDDEALLKPNPIPSIFIDYDAYNPCIYGNVLICHNDGERELTTIQPWEVSMLKENIYLALWNRTPIKVLKATGDYEE